MTLSKNITGHLSALVTILIWGTTFISTKLLLTDFSPVEILFMLPALFHFEVGVQRFSNPVNLFNILFLGLGASALCFVTWNTAVKLLGADKCVYLHGAGDYSGYFHPCAA